MKPPEGFSKQQRAGLYLTDAARELVRPRSEFSNVPNLMARFTISVAAYLEESDRSLTLDEMDRVANAAMIFAWAVERDSPVEPNRELVKGRNWPKLMRLAAAAVQQPNRRPYIKTYDYLQLLDQLEDGDLRIDTEAASGDPSDEPSDRPPE